MKVLLINGSPRKKGNTFLALSEAAKTLKQQGFETEIVQIGVKPVRGCIACGQCESVCPQHLPITSLLEKAAEMFE